MTQLSDDCHTSLYRILWDSGDGSDGKDVLVVAFALESTRESARRFFAAALALIAGKPAGELDLSRLDSYRDLVNSGISDDEELRVFEIAWRGVEITGWVERPLFLTTDPTLVGKWALLQADLAAQGAREAIDRAGGRR
ncbi:hypothetical protein [Paraburkholderia terricola]|uniref:Uncharacterized protein n=1 Tax=Paraburkholderia terricola TaxID=169427 RepID=A0ABU1M221_9BURK|nr:hypothetical protein [Paraburkholderia terricola]MDR6413056.1 hypothetical protein [Paraburkholderia terricola]MDR6485206.1 hypothetical protein [Paraburkholderia terricola]